MSGTIVPWRTDGLSKSARLILVWDYVLAEMTGQDQDNKYEGVDVAIDEATRELVGIFSEFTVPKKSVFGSITLAIEDTDKEILLDILLESSDLPRGWMEVLKNMGQRGLASGEPATRAPHVKVKTDLSVKGTPRKSESFAVWYAATTSRLETMGVVDQDDMEVSIAASMTLSDYSEYARLKDEKGLSWKDKIHRMVISIDGLSKTLVMKKLDMVQQNGRKVGSLRTEFLNALAEYRVFHTDLDSEEMLVMKFISKLDCPRFVERQAPKSLEEAVAIVQDFTETKMQFSKATPKKLTGKLRNETEKKAMATGSCFQWAKNKTCNHKETCRFKHEEVCLLIGNGADIACRDERNFPDNLQIKCRFPPPTTNLPTYVPPSKLVISLAVDGDDIYVEKEAFVDSGTSISLISVKALRNICNGWKCFATSPLVHSLGSIGGTKEIICSITMRIRGLEEDVLFHVVDTPMFEIILGRGLTELMYAAGMTVDNVVGWMTREMKSVTWKDQPELLNDVIVESVTPFQESQDVNETTRAGLEILSDSEIEQVHKEAYEVVLRKIIESNLSEDNKTRLREAVTPGMCGKDMVDLKGNCIMDFEVDFFFDDGPPIFSKPIRQGLVLEAIQEKILSQMQEAGRFQKDEQPEWTSACFLKFQPRIGVDVPDALRKLRKCSPSLTNSLEYLVNEALRYYKFRLLIDYRRVNERTVQYFFDMPELQDFRQFCYGKKVFSTVDFVKFYYQFKYSDTTRRKLGIITPSGVWVPNYMTLGPTNNPAVVSQFLRTKIIHNVPNSFGRIDDVLTADEDEDAHVDGLITLFKNCQTTGAMINADKLVLAASEVVVVGHTLNAEGILPPEEYILDIQAFEPPKTMKQMQSFLALVEWVAKYTPRLQEHTGVLSSMTRGKTLAKWTPASLEAFEETKRLVSDPSILVHPNFSEQFTVIMDASDSGIFGLLFQSHGMVGCVGRKLTDAERKYPAIERELLAMIYVIEKYRDWLLLNPFIVLSDHMPLEYLSSMKYSSKRLFAWIFRLGEYRFAVKHIKGIDNPSDFPSRCFPGDHVMMWHEEYPSYEEFYHSLRTLMDGKMKVEFSGAKYKYLRYLKKKATLEDDVVYFGALEVPCPQKMQELLRGHFPLHTPARSMYKMLRRKYYWPGMYKDCQKVTRNCDSCQRVYSFPKDSRLYQRLECDIMHTVQLDFVGPFPDKRSIFTAVDLVSGRAFATWVDNHRTSTLVGFIYLEIIRNFGISKILGDNEFDVDILKQLGDVFGVTVATGTPNNSTSQAHVERFNGILQDSLLRVSQGAALDELTLQEVVRNFNNQPGELGLSPNEIVFLAPHQSGKCKTLFDNSQLVDHLAEFMEDRRVMREEISARLFDYRFKEPTIAALENLKVNDLVLWRHRVKGKRQKDELRNWGPFVVVHVNEATGSVKFKYPDGTLQNVHQRYLIKYNPNIANTIGIVPNEGALLEDFDEEE